MAMMVSCGWTLIAPLGEADLLKKHVKTHMVDAHPGMKISDADTMKTV